MIELTLLTILFTIVVLVIKPGRTPPLENPLTIERIGQFRATLAPKLNLAQPLLESISKNLSEQARSSGDTRTLYFSINDGDVKAHGAKYYLLSVTLHHEMLYFAVCSPLPLIYDYNTILNASATALSELQQNKETISENAEGSLIKAVLSSADQFGVKIFQLTIPG
jgi:hypothetical protein